MKELIRLKKRRRENVSAWLKLSPKRQLEKISDFLDSQREIENKEFELFHLLMKYE